jgi:hypothetical protein
MEAGKSVVKELFIFSKEIDMKRSKIIVVLLGTMALLALLVVGSIGAAPLYQDVDGDIDIDIDDDDIDIDIDIDIDDDIDVDVDADAEPGPSGTAIRIDFELAPGHSAKKGHYSVQLPGGAEVASWYALDGWLDSGWISDLDIKGDTVLVDVLYYPGPDTEPTKMLILNPAPGTDEVAWPDMPIENTGFDVMGSNVSENTEFDN